MKIKKVITNTRLFMGVNLIGFSVYYYNYFQYIKNKDFRYFYI